jgi:GR25 family glycosyltransferase involved in LPS biosynthesis
MRNDRVGLPDYFGAALVINLEERTDRRKSVEREFQKLGWTEYKFFPAFRFDDAAGFELPSLRGCFTSHLECLRLAQKQQLANILIFEDDIALSSSIRQLTPTIIETIHRLDWDFLYFGHELTGDIGRANSKTSSITFEPCSSEIRTAHFYAVNGRIIPNLIAHLEQNARTIPGDQYFGPMPLDGALNTFRRYNKNATTYIANPKLGWQRPSRSDITPGRLDGIMALRSFVSFSRDVKQFLSRLSR